MYEREIEFFISTTKVATAKLSQIGRIPVTGDVFGVDIFPSAVAVEDKQAAYAVSRVLVGDLHNDGDGKPIDPTMLGPIEVHLVLTSRFP